jgi:hypothetical protein
VTVHAYPPFLSVFFPLTGEVYSLSDAASKKISRENSAGYKIMGRSTAKGAQMRP